MGAAFSRFGHFVLAAIATTILGLNVNWGYLLTQEWADMPLLLRALYLIAAINIKVLTLFCGFTSMESNFIASGQGYTPATKDKPECFNSLRQIYMTDVLSQVCWTNAITRWNI